MIFKKFNYSTKIMAETFWPVLLNFSFFKTNKLRILLNKYLLYLNPVFLICHMNMQQTKN